MNHVAAAERILDTMLGYLGFVVRIEVDESRPDPCLMVLSEEGELLTGEEGDRLDDIQYLVNRLLQNQDPGAPRIRVDVNHFRSMQEDELLEEAETLARRVINTGRPAKIRPLNSYHRRIIHNHFIGHEKVKTWSPNDQARMKAITIMPKNAASAEASE